VPETITGVSIHCPTVNERNGDLPPFCHSYGAGTNDWGYNPLGLYRIAHPSRHDVSMPMPPSSGLIAILRAALRRVEQQFGSDNPRFLQFKRLILLTIAELEIERAKKTSDGTLSCAVVSDVPKLSSNFDHQLDSGWPYPIWSTCKFCGVSRLVSVSDGSLEEWERTHGCQAAAKSA
jgi:hypothetical protein